MLKKLDPSIRWSNCWDIHLILCYIIGETSIQNTMTHPYRKHWKQAPWELKRNTIERCSIGGESVKSVAEDIGYSPSFIYKWLRDYQKEGFIPSMKKPKADTPHIPSDI